MNLYAESSAVLSWIFREAPAPHLKELLDRADLVVASDLTLVECERALVRAQAMKALSEAEEAIAVFQGRLRPPEGPAWPLAIGIALLDFLLAWILVTLFQRLGAGKVSCGAAALLPLIYLGQIVAGVTALAAGRDRQGR